MTNWVTDWFKFSQKVFNRLNYLIVPFGSSTINEKATQRSSQYEYIYCQLCLLISNLFIAYFGPLHDHIEGNHILLGFLFFEDHVYNKRRQLIVVIQILFHIFQIRLHSYKSLIKMKHNDEIHKKILFLLFKFNIVHNQYSFVVITLILLCMDQQLIKSDNAKDRYCYLCSVKPGTPSAV